MKVSIGTNIVEGPWGGGNLFAINLKKYLTLSGHKVVFDLDDDDIDIILMTEPRKTSESSAFTHVDILKYISFVNENVIVVHRINECDERKNTNFVNQYLIEANIIADGTVFVSTWLKNLFLNQGLSNKQTHIILSGADKNIFNKDLNSKWDKDSKIKLVTHHWGANWNKGFEIYKFLDEILSKKEYKEKIEFIYIGNLPKKFKFKNSIHIEPTSGNTLSNEIKKNHIYLTASINEPSGNHHIEGAQCGLPLLYLESGGTPEYAKGYGVSFEPNNFEEKLNYLIDNYDTYYEKVKLYPNNSDLMCQEYESLFNNLISNKSTLLRDRDYSKKKNIIEKFFYLAIRKITNNYKN